MLVDYSKKVAAPKKSERIRDHKPQLQIEADTSSVRSNTHVLPVPTTDIQAERAWGQISEETVYYRPSPISCLTEMSGNSLIDIFDIRRLELLHGTQARAPEMKIMAKNTAGGNLPNMEID